MVSLASGMVEFEKVDSELTMVHVESGEFLDSLEGVYDAMVAETCGLAPCHSGGGGFAPKVFCSADVFDALSCCNLEIDLTFGDIAFCPCVFSVFLAAMLISLLWNAWWCSLLTLLKVFSKGFT